MKAITTLGTAVLFAALGSLVPAFAQQQKEEPKQEEKQPQQHAQPQQQHAQSQQAKPQSEKAPAQPQQRAQQQTQQKPQAAQQQQHAQQQTQQKQQQAQQHNQQAAQQQQHAQQQNQQAANQQHAQHTPEQQRAQHTPEQQRAQQVAWQGHESNNWQSDHRTWQQRGGYHGYRIPDNRYNGYFGPNYGFVIYNQPYMVVGGFPRFQYNGFWFSLVDPWPNTWANDWYQTDDVYVVYQDNGYYMYNQRYPGVGIAISVSM